MSKFQVTREPSLRALSFVLRHRELWPVGFTWDYADRSTCAIGLAKRLWPLVADKSVLSTARASFRMTEGDAQKIFLNGDHDALPERVADLMDHYLMRMQT